MEEEKNLDTQYILIAGKDEKDLAELLKDLEGYIVEKTSDSEIDIKHSFEGFSIYISIKEEFTRILNNYWREEKIYVEIVASKNNIISKNSKELTEQYLKEKGFTKWGFIIDTNYKQRKQLYNANLKEEIKNTY